MTTTEILSIIGLILLLAYVLWSLFFFDYPFFWSFRLRENKKGIERLLSKFIEKRQRAKFKKEQEAVINHLKQWNMDKELIKENLSRAEDLMAQALGEYNVATASQDNNYHIYKEIFSIYERLSKLNLKLTKEL